MKYLVVNIEEPVYNRTFIVKTDNKLEGFHMNEEQTVAKKVLKEVVKYELVEDNLLKEFEISLHDFYSFFEDVMNYADERNLLDFKCEYYSLVQTSMIYEGNVFIFSEFSGSKDQQALIIELSKDVKDPKFTYEEFKAFL